MPVPVRAKEPVTDDLPLEEQIRKRAYELYVQRGSEAGSEVDDWLQAEEEVIEARDQYIDSRE